MEREEVEMRESREQRIEGKNRNQKCGNRKTSGGGRERERERERAREKERVAK
jgi:hypothetical protein